MGIIQIVCEFLAGSGFMHLLYGTLRTKISQYVSKPLDKRFTKLVNPCLEGFKTQTFISYSSLFVTDCWSRSARFHTWTHGHSATENSPTLFIQIYERIVPFLIKPYLAIESNLPQTGVCFPNHSKHHHASMSILYICSGLVVNSIVNVRKPGKYGHLMGMLFFDVLQSLIKHFKNYFQLHSLIVETTQHTYYPTINMIDLACSW